MTDKTTVSASDFFRSQIEGMFPTLKGRVTVAHERRGRHIFEARKNGRGVKLTVTFTPSPSNPQWPEWLFESARACHEIIAGRTSAVATRRFA